MKKLVLVLIGIIIAGASYHFLVPCSINGYSCQNVINTLDNPNELNKMGLNITYIKRGFFDGGSAEYMLSNGVIIFDKWSHGPDYISVSFPDGKFFVFDYKGKIKKRQPIPKKLISNLVP